MTRHPQPLRETASAAPASSPLPLVKALLAVGLVAPLAAYGATITVQTTLAESGVSCTLRDAARSINTGAPVGACVPVGLLTDPNTVNFDPGVTGTISYANDMPGNPFPYPTGLAFVPFSNLSIVGPGVSSLTIGCSAPGISGVFALAANVAADISISGLTVSGCTSTAPASQVAAGLTVAANTGGNVMSTVTLTDLAVLNNTGNTAGIGGLTAIASNVAIDRVLVAGNSTGQIGGVLVIGLNTTIRNSAITSNSTFLGASTLVSGVYMQGINTATLQNTTVSGNSGNVIAAAFIQSNQVLVDHATVVRNTSIMAQSTGLIYSDAGASPAVAPLRNSIVCGNTGFDVLGQFANAVATADFSLLGTTPAPSPAPIGTGNVTGCTAAQLDGWLGPLGNNGGPTPTHALLNVAGNPAVNSGDPAYAEPPSTDQRGGTFQRVVAGRTDMGAFEFGAGGPPAVPTPVPALGPVALGALSAALAALGMRRRRKAGEK